LHDCCFKACGTRQKFNPVHRPFSERPFLERPFSERPISERPISEGDHSPNDHSPKATILRTTNIRKRPILGRLIIAEATMGAIFAIAKNREKCMTQQTLDNIGTVSKLLHILPDFLSLLHLIFHLCHRRHVSVLTVIYGYNCD
jgi:hypothetical protein